MGLTAWLTNLTIQPKPKAQPVGNKARPRNAHQLLQIAKKDVWFLNSHPTHIYIPEEIRTQQLREYKLLSNYPGSKPGTATHDNVPKPANSCVSSVPYLKK